MRRNTYANIINLGQTNQPLTSVDNPLTYCMNDKDQYFEHGTQGILYGSYSKSCQAFMADYCAKGFDGFCEVASNNIDKNHPNQIQLEKMSDQLRGLTAGEMLIKNTAAKKYLVMMDHCRIRNESFDPLVASSPMISYWDGGQLGTCEQFFAIQDPTDIDNDIVMNKLLDRTYIYPELFPNIYLTMKEAGTLNQLDGSKLGEYLKQYDGQ